MTNSGLWTITYNIINNAWTATRTGDLPQNTYNIHVIEYKGGTPYLYVFNAGSANSANFPGSKMTETEVSAAGETWYKTTLSTTASTISVIASLGGSSSQTADITGIAPGDYYIVFNGTTKEILSQGTTMPEGKQQAEKNAFTVYVKADDAPYIYLWDDNNVALNNKTWPGVLMSGTEQLADGTNWWRFVVETYDNDINLLFHNNGGGSGNQSADIKQTEAVGYYVYDGNQKAVQTVEPTGKMYVIGQVGGNPWSATMGKEMTAESDGTTFTLNNVQIIAGSTFAFASRMADESLEGDAAWAMLNSYRLTSNPGNGGTFWGVTNAMTDKDNPRALDLRIWNGADKNFRMDETAYYDITVDMKAMTVTIKRRYGALYMFYGDNNSPYWKPNAGVPMFTTDGKTFMLTNVELDVDDTFQFATQLGADENTWPANTYRYGANSAGNNNWLVTESQIDVVLENALRAETGKDFQMGSGTAGTYRVMVNPEAKTVALYRMADVTGSKVIIHLEKTSNVTNPKIWAYDKERDLADTAYIHVDRPSRIEIATNRHALREGQDPDTIVTVGGRQWWTWEVGKAIADFWFTRNGYDYESVQTTALENKDMTDIQWRRSGEIYLTWPTTGTAMEDHTRDYYAAAAQEAPECAVMIEGHLYAYFTNTPGWEHVFCHAWYTDDQGFNHDLLTPPSPYEGGPCYPGALCEMIGYDKDGYEVWRIDLTAAGVTTYPNGGILFNNGIDDNHVYEHDMNHDYYTGTGTLDAKEQSSDFAYSTGACYDYCGLIVLGRSLSNIIR
ncbi:MAG: starch-binding protein, partial [Muribaculaceae bacterium]|nr:starch-binding protein [Muribaculaceae bacterium]